MEGEITAIYSKITAMAYNQSCILLRKKETFAQPLKKGSKWNFHLIKMNPYLS